MTKLQSLGLTANPYDLVLYNAIKNLENAVKLCTGELPLLEAGSAMDVNNKIIASNIESLEALESEDLNGCFGSAYAHENVNATTLKTFAARMQATLFSGELGTEMYFPWEFEKVFYTEEQLHRHEELREFILTDDKVDISADFTFDADFRPGHGEKPTILIDLYERYLDGEQVRFYEKFNVWKHKYQMTVKDAEYATSYLGLLLGWW